MFTKSRDGGGAAFSVAIDVTFSFVIAMVVSRLPAGCRVDASASCPLNSASAVTSAYQRPAASCPLAHFFPFAYVCWLVITSPHVAPPPPCIAFCCTAAFTSILDPPLFVSTGWLLRRILSHRLRLSKHHRLACCLLRHLRLTFASSPSLAPQFSSPPLSLSRRRGHCQHPQMHGALSRRRYRQRPLFPFVRLSSSNTSACTPARV